MCMSCYTVGLYSPVSVNLLRKMHRNKNASGKNKKLVNIVQIPSAPGEYTLQKNVELNGKIYSYVQNFTFLTQVEQEELRAEKWFQVGLPREISLEILLQSPPGTFLVRQSETYLNCFALSMRSPSRADDPKLSHYLIEKSPNGYKFRGFVREFPTIKSLVIHHSILKGPLPCPLLLNNSLNHLLDESDSEMKSTTSCFCKK